MDIYVLTEQGRVLGAGASRTDCETIADRRGPEGWSEWLEAGPGQWERQHGAGIWSEVGNVQTITETPLAGYADMTFPLSPDTQRLMERDRAEHARVTRMHQLLIETARPKGPTVEQLVRVVESLKALPKNPGPIRVGDGPAWDWLRRGLERMATYPADQTLPDSVAARIMGIDVVLDRDLPPNVMRFGSKIWIVDDETGNVYETTEQQWPALYFFGKDSVIEPIVPPSVFRIGNVT